jgi:hypothetical protein
MTTQTVQLDLYDYGAATLTVTLRDPDTLAVVATADSVTQSVNLGTRYDAVFSTLVAAGVYAVGVVQSGVPGLLYCTLAGTDGETVTARGERVDVPGFGDTIRHVQVARDAGTKRTDSTMTRIP